jgi:5-methylcytosine-specific restriction enzyme subunit McrC
MHILCRFFIEHVGPRVNIGEQTMLPFLVNMWHLFELFVFEWLKRNLPSDYEVNKQEKFYLGDDNNLYFEADLVIKEKYTGEVKYILDTKYKNQTSPEANDLAQVIAYAQTKGAKEAVLIYPINLDNPFHGKSGDINLRCLSFCIEDNLDKAGTEFLQQLFNYRE